MKKYKEGDIITFEQCWKDESGHYHDELAELIRIKTNGELELKWLVDSPGTLIDLEHQNWTVDDLPE